MKDISILVQAYQLVVSREIAQYLKNHPETKLAFQPGTFQMKLGTEILADIYAESDIFFCNVEEAQRILKSEEHDKVKLMQGLMNLGPKLICMTDGIKGAYTYDGRDAFFIGVYPHTPIERTGAGDAFASTFTTAILLGISADEALKWGPINSMSVVQQVGAQKGLLTREKLEEYLKNAPETYKAEKIN
jgi:ribokinase